MSGRVGGWAGGPPSGTSSPSWGTVGPWVQWIAYPPRRGEVDCLPSKCKPGATAPSQGLGSFGAARKAAGLAVTLAHCRGSRSAPPDYSVA